MPTLERIGKEKVNNHHQKASFEFWKGGIPMMMAKVSI